MTLSKRLLMTALVVSAVVTVVQAQEVFKPGDGVSLPTVVKQVQPQYTQEALAARIEGAVTLTTVVLSDGSVGDVTVSESLDSMLDEQAVKAMKQWTFKPGIKDGKPVSVRVDIRINFTLK
jgi:protein TonB